MATIELLRRRSIVGSVLLSYQIPCCRSNLNDTRLQRMSGHRATLSSRMMCSPRWPWALILTVPYPWIHTCVLPAHTQSPGIGKRRFSIRLGLLQMCVVDSGVQDEGILQRVLLVVGIETCHRLPILDRRYGSSLQSIILHVRCLRHLDLRRGRS